MPGRRRGPSGISGCQLTSSLLRLTKWQWHILLKRCRRKGGEVPASPECLDRLRVRLFALLSDRTLRKLGQLAAVMVAKGVWPTEEEVALAELLPKTTETERPISLFRPAMPIAAKVHAAKANQWLCTRAPWLLSAVLGHKGGDAMRRHQLKMALQDVSWGVAAELAVDLRKTSSPREEIC